MQLEGATRVRGKRKEVDLVGFCISNMPSAGDNMFDPSGECIKMPVAFKYIYSLLKIIGGNKNE